MAISSLATLDTAVTTGVSVGGSVTWDPTPPNFIDMWDGSTGSAAPGTALTYGGGLFIGDAAALLGADVSFTVFSSYVSAALLLDRLVAISSVSMSTISATINSTALPRETTGAGVWLFAVCIAPAGSTSGTMTATYTNQSGTAGRTATAWSADWGNAGQMVAFTLQAGDTGVRSVQSVVSSVHNGTGFGLVLAKPLCALPLDAGSQDRFSMALIDIPAGAVPSVAFLAHWTYGGSGAAAKAHASFRVALK